MGGAGPDPNAKGGKRALDASVNLVPYIDLLMTIMTFLVMTAVWTQIASLEIQNSSGGQQEEQEEKDEDKPKPILVVLTDRGLKVGEEGAEEPLVDYPNTADGYDFAAAKTQLKGLKDARPERVQINVKAEDGVAFEPITKVIDIAHGLSLTGLTLQPASQ
jgi:biopolymer transport protein ExbD